MTTYLYENLWIILPIKDIVKFEHLFINHLQLNTQRAWHTGEVNNTTSTHRISALSCCHKIVMGYVVNEI